MIEKSKVIEHFGSVAKVADFFDIEPQAVYQWAESIPRERQLELMVRLPDVFGEKPKAKREARAS